MIPMHNRTAQVRFGIVAHSVAAYLIMQAQAQNPPAPTETPKPSQFDTLDKMHASHKRCIEILRSTKKTANIRKALAKRAARGSHYGKR